MQHAIATYRNRRESGEDGTGVKDDFYDAQLFRVDTVATIEMGEDTADAWIIEMTIFYSIGLPQDNMSLDERKRLVVRSRKFLSPKRQTIPQRH